jgi:cyclase
VLKKRLVGVVTIRNGWAVQSFGYRRYLPLGKPEILIENLDRWGADEILVQCIDRSVNGAGPDFDLLERIGRIGVSTPLIYVGGIRDAVDAVRSVKLGADRVAVDAILRDCPEQLVKISKELGAQALIADLPVRLEGDCLRWLDYRNRREEALSGSILNVLEPRCVSEVMLSDWSHEGSPQSFDEALVNAFPLADMPLIVFGGLSTAAQMQRLLERSQVVAAAVGNFLSYEEHAIQTFKRALKGISLRPAVYSTHGY